MSIPAVIIGIVLPALLLAIGLWLTGTDDPPDNYDSEPAGHTATPAVEETPAPVTWHTYPEVTPLTAADYRTDTDSEGDAGRVIVLP